VEGVILVGVEGDFQLEGASDRVVNLTLVRTCDTLAILALDLASFTLMMVVNAVSKREGAASILALVREGAGAAEKGQARVSVGRADSSLNRWAADSIFTTNVFLKFRSGTSAAT